jgi:hypothetical protein
MQLNQWQHWFNGKLSKILTVITTPPPFFWPKVRPSGLSTSASIVFEAPAVLAVISSLFLAMEEEPLLLSTRKDPETPLLASWSERPSKDVFCRYNSKIKKY